MDLQELRSGFREPPRTAAPMMRWWWFGPAVDRAELDRELTVMAQAGLGGVEVAYVYPFAPDSDTFLSPGFLADLRHAAETAAGLGLRFDLTLGSGWSFGGPHVGPEHVARRLHWDRREIGPEPLAVPVRAAWPGDELVAAYVGPGSLQEPPPELTLLAVVDDVIMVPAGSGVRQVLLAWSRPTGQQVKRAAVGAEGPVFDHYSPAAARVHLREVGDRLLDAVPARLLGSVFCDSLEVFGADWTPDLVAEFRTRRGYDPVPELYRLLIDGPEAARLRIDLHQTLVDRYEEVVAELRGWAAHRGVPFRIQGYGIPPALISSYRHADGIEGEGWGWTDLTQTRWASSAAHHYDRPVVSSEVWTWVHSPSFRATPLDLKGEAHEHLLAGVNQLVGHGWPYSPPDAPGLGWMFYASGALDDRNPWWPAMAPLARYLTRLCWLLRQGAPVADVLVHVSDADLLARLGTATGGSLDAWREARELVGTEVLPAIRRAGWDYDLVDDTALTSLPDHEARPVIMSGTTMLATAARDRLARHLAAGGTVLTVDADVELPGAVAVDAPGLADRLTATAGPGVRLEPTSPDVGVVRRRLPGADVLLVVNTGPAAQAFELRPPADRPWFEQWEAETGSVVRSGPVADGVALTLHPYQSTVIVLNDAEPPVAPHRRGDGRRVVLENGWRVRFADQEETAATPVELPHGWESTPERASFSGSAVYTVPVELPIVDPGSWTELDLGPAVPTVAGPGDAEGIRGHSYRVGVEGPVGVVAVVRVNGVDCGTAWAPPYVVDVSRAVRPGPNQIQITVHNTAANALAHDPHRAEVVAATERRHGRRAQLQDLDRALVGVRSGLLAVPTLLIG